MTANADRRAQLVGPQFKKCPKCSDLFVPNDPEKDKWCSVDCGKNGREADRRARDKAEAAQQIAMQDQETERRRQQQERERTRRRANLVEGLDMARELLKRHARQCEECGPATDCAEAKEMRRQMDEDGVELASLHAMEGAASQEDHGGTQPK